MLANTIRALRVIVFIHANKLRMQCVGAVHTKALNVHVPTLPARINKRRRYAMQ